MFSRHPPRAVNPPISLPFDESAVARLRRFGGDTLLFEMIDRLSTAAPERLQAARDAIAGGDVERARAAFHSLKSSAGQLGGAAVQALCERAEHLARTGDVAAMGSLMPELDAEYEAMHSRLVAIRGGEGR